MDAIQVPMLPPRNPHAFADQIPFAKGLGPYFFFGYFFAFGMLIPVISILFTGSGEIIKGAMPMLVVTLAIFWIIAFFLLSHAFRARGNRYKAFANGYYTEGRVIAHGRSSVFYRSSDDFTVTVSFRNSKGEQKQVQLRSGKRQIQKDLPLGKILSGVYDQSNDVAFFPEEVGVIFDFQELWR